MQHIHEIEGYVLNWECAIVLCNLIKNNC